MVEHGITTTELSNILGISLKELEKKINGLIDWYFRESMFLVRYFGYSEVREVFPELYNYYL